MFVDVVYLFKGDTHYLIALYILSLFIDQLSNKRVQSCYLIKVLLHHTVIPQ